MNISSSHVQNTFFLQTLWYSNWTQGVGSEVKFPLTEGSSVNKENPQQTFPVVVVVWISITVLPVKIINPPKELSFSHENALKILKLNLNWFDWATLGPWTFDLEATAPCTAPASQGLEKEGILDMAQGNVHFQQHVWEYFPFKHLLRYSDDGSLPLVEKICDSMGFRAANRVWVDKVQTASCFSVLPLLPIVKRVTGVKQ